MTLENSSSTHTLLVSVSVAFGVVAVTGVVLYFLTKKSKKMITLLNADEKYALPLIEKEEISHDTRRFRFGLPSAEHTLGLPVGQHIYLNAQVDEKLVIRPYTPVSSEDDHGYMDLVVKIYFKNVHPRFPNGGKMTQHLESLKIGDKIDVRGPSGLLTYKSKGEFEVKPNKRKPAENRVASKVGMIAGGSGITPMLQLIRAVLKNPEDKTEIYLLFANQTESDILLRDELDSLHTDHPEQFHLHYTLDRADDSWKHSVGFVNADMLANHMPPVGEETLILMCGPPAMIEFACVPNLNNLGYTAERRFAF